MASSVPRSRSEPLSRNIAIASITGPVRKLWLVNTTAVTRTVTVKTSSAGSFIKTISLAATGTVGDQAELDFGVSTYIAGWGASADAAGVNAFAIQGDSFR